jgi:hypothetical protein
MRCGLTERFESGWIGMYLALRPGEIDTLISWLGSLKQGADRHFHLTATDWSGDPGIADIEIGLQGEDEIDNMAVR